MSGMDERERAVAAAGYWAGRVYDDERRRAAAEAVVEAARRIPEIMGSNPRDARFSEYAYEALFTAADEISAALAALDALTQPREDDQG